MGGGHQRQRSYNKLYIQVGYSRSKLAEVMA
jgi:hypothetical protein